MKVKNGYFKLDMRDTGVFLIVYPPEKGGEPVGIKEITVYLNEKKLTEYDRQKMKQLINNTEEVGEIYVGAWNGIYQDEMMRLTVSEDKMLVFCRLYPPSNEGKLMTAEDIIRDLNLQKIVVGIDSKEIENFIKERTYCTNYIFAKGIPPVHGTDARIEYFFNTNPNLKPKMNDDGTVNYHELNTISRVEEGDLLAKLHEPVKGEAGQNVYGGVISARQEKSLKLEFSNNISISEDRTEIYSQLTGHASLINGKVFVSGVFEVPGNVDNTTGDILYSGNVFIKGNVKTGFTVKAKGDIVVEGVVEAAFLSSGGQIIVKRGIHGMSKGKVEAKGNIITTFIEYATVISGGFVEAGTILQSQVSAANEVRVNGKKGFITGGLIRAGNMVEAQNIGSYTGSITKVEVGVEPEVKEHYNQLQRKILEISKEMEKMKPALISYREKIARKELVSPDRVLQVQTIANIYKEKQSELAQMREEFMKIHEQIQLSTTAKVKVNGTAYQGVSIAISDVSMNVKGTISYSKFVKEQGEIVVHPL